MPVTTHCVCVCTVIVRAVDGFSGRTRVTTQGPQSSSPSTKGVVVQFPEDEAQPTVRVSTRLPVRASVSSQPDAAGRVWGPRGTVRVGSGISPTFLLPESTGSDTVGSRSGSDPHGVQPHSKVAVLHVTVRRCGWVVVTT